VEYVAKLRDSAATADCIVSLACGAGVQFVAENYMDKWVVPGRNTKFAGVTKEHGVWEERVAYVESASCIKLAGYVQLFVVLRAY
jgi:hypothetical protein